MTAARPKPTPENLRAAYVAMMTARDAYEAARRAWLDLCAQCKGDEARDATMAVHRAAGAKIDDDAE